MLWFFLTVKCHYGKLRKSGSVGILCPFEKMTQYLGEIKLIYRATKYVVAYIEKYIDLVVEAPHG